MKKFLLLLLTLLGLSATCWSQEATPDELAKEVNFLRTQPKKYAEILRQERKYFTADSIKRPGQPIIRVDEGVAALDEAIAFLEQQEGLPALTHSTGLTMAAADHTREQAASGEIGHSGTDGNSVSERIGRYGKATSTGENLAYGFCSAREIVIQLVVDDGLPERGHRKNFFGREWQYVGCYAGTHPKYRYMCTITFARDYIEDSEAQKKYVPPTKVVPGKGKRPGRN